MISGKMDDCRRNVGKATDFGIDFHDFGVKMFNDKICNFNKILNDQFIFNLCDSIIERRYDDLKPKTKRFSVEEKLIFERFFAKNHQIRCDF